MTDGKFSIADYVMAALGVVLAVACALLASEGAMPWWVAIIFIVVGGILGTVIFIAGPRPYINQLEITEHGITRRFGPKFRSKKQESVTWNDLSKVEIDTTNDGPFSEDFFYMLYGKNGNGVVVTNRLAVEHNLLAELQKRLPGLDNRAVALASGCTENRSFVIWPGNAA